MKYPTVRVTGIHGEYMAYQAMYNGEPFFVQKAKADASLEGPEAYVANAVEEEFKCSAGY